MPHARSSWIAPLISCSWRAAGEPLRLAPVSLCRHSAGDFCRKPLFVANRIGLEFTTRRGFFAGGRSRRANRGRSLTPADAIRTGTNGPGVPRNRSRLTAIRSHRVVHSGGRKIRRTVRKSFISRGFCIGDRIPSLASPFSKSPPSAPLPLRPTVRAQNAALSS
jgi:hypothetical protein